jgi:hypothetical protein
MDLHIFVSLDMNKCLTEEHDIWQGFGLAWLEL